MNKDRTLQLIRQRFVNLTDSSADVVRAERRHNGTPMGVFYFDFSQAVAAEGFDLRSYMQERIATDFYKHEGPLQWNYYLYFVLDRAALSKLRETPRAAQIEGDRTFARKFLRDPETLDTELAQPLAATLHSAAPSQDIASRWVEELKNAGLERIADPAADYAPTIREYLAGTTAKPRSIPAVPAAPVANGRFVQSLRLDQFRAHPAERNFTFGTVNLIRGVNGTGKTSLLEAIELCVCGGNRRQRGERPNGARLQIQFEGQTQPQRCPESNAANYRARDLAWYGGYYLQGNRLFDNFGRFNFFDSDAAYLLSAATNGETILKAITSLLLGEYANTIEERMGQCKERFAREQRELAKLVQIRRKELARANDELNQVKAIKDTREALVSELQTKAEVAGWKRAPARHKLDDLALLEEAVDDRAERLSQDTARLAWMARISVATLRREAAQLAGAIKEIAEHRESIEKNTAALEKDRERIATLDAEVRVLNRLKQYHGEAEAMTLAGTGEAVAAVRAKVARYKEAMGLVRGLNLKPFEQVTLPLEEIMVQQTADIAKRRRNLTKFRNRASELQTQLGAIKSVVEEIKGLGIRFCEVNPSGKTCPLCGTVHDDLRQRIAALSVRPAIETPLGELTTEIAREQAALDELQQTTAALAQLRQAAQLLSTASQLSGRSAKAIIETLSEAGDKLATEKTRLDGLIVKEKRLKLAGFSEEELSELLEEAVEEYGLPRTKLDKADGVQALLTDRTKALETVRAAVKDKEKHEKEALAEIRRLTVRYLGESRVGAPDIELERRKTTVDEVLAGALESKNPVVLTESDEFSAVQAKLAAFAKVIRRIHEALKRVEEKDALEQRLTASAAEAQRELASLEPKHGRAATAVGVLEKLLGSDYKAAYLDKMVADHKQKLATIFSRIHAPYEFKDVHLSADMLLERDTGAKSRVSEISTGQRAALALSIFLSLNSSVTTRAPWLIFDDPVAHVDDLNVLSFLDMLRDLVLLGDRQVFFATANSRIADLFAKKFDCLGQNFKDVRLQR